MSEGQYFLYFIFFSAIISDRSHVTMTGLSRGRGGRAKCAVQDANRVAFARTCQFWLNRDKLENTEHWGVS